MPPLDKRVGKLEEDLQAAARQAQSIDRMPDRDLIALLIEEQGRSALHSYEDEDQH